jgi:heterodisulfide reductase subunit B
MMVNNDVEKLKTINTVLDREVEYKGEVQVVHYLEVLKEIGLPKIREKVKNPLSEITIAPYYGCMLLRPKEVGVDDPEDPIILKHILQTLGATVIDTPYKTKCCGSYLTVNKKRVVIDMTYDRLRHFQKSGAEAVAVTCPLCAFNLDNRQAEVKELHPDFQTIPILYFTQFMAIAFGLDEEFFGFNSNYVDPKPLLKSKGLLGLN